MKTSTIFVLLICFFYNYGYCQCIQLTLHDLISTVKLTLDDREDVFVRKGYQYIDGVNGSKVFGKCKTIVEEEDKYHQYIVISDNIVHYMTDNSQTYLDIKKMVKAKYKPNAYRNKYDTEMTIYTNAGIGFSFDFENIHGQLLYIIHVTNNL